MIIDSQRINYKIPPFDSRYSRKVQENINASPATFTDLETPGWSSMMRSQISERTKRTNREKQGNKQTDILNRLKEQKQLIWSRADEKKMVTSKAGIDKNETRDTDRVRHSMSVKQFNKPTGKKSEQKNKRWNQISVHEYLYENSKKLENKKMMSKILDEQFKKQVYKFAPTINKKSIILAESKFSRSKQNAQIKKQENTMQTQATDIKQKLDKDVERYKVLNRTFYFLTDGKLVLTEQQLQKNLLELPMPCIKVVQPIVTKIYQGTQMQWLDFLENFNCQCKNGKQGFYVVISKWFARSEIEHTKGNDCQPLKEKCK